MNSAQVHCSRVPQITPFGNFFIKNGSHGTIYTFKNYFATVISAISFQFQQNKSYPNRPLKNLNPKTMPLRQVVVIVPAIQHYHLCGKHSEPENGLQSLHYDEHN